MQIRTYNSETLNCKRVNCKTSRQTTNRCQVNQVTGQFEPELIVACPNDLHVIRLKRFIKKIYNYPLPSPPLPTSPSLPPPVVPCAQRRHVIAVRYNGT